MAYITKRGSKWQARVSWADASGEIHQKAKSGFPTKTAAKQFAYEWETRKAHNQISDKDPVFADYLKQWYLTYKENKLSPATKNRYNIVIDIVKKYFKSRKISAITRQQYQQFINEFGKDHAKITVQKTNSIIKTCIENAVYDGIITQNFAKRCVLTWNKDKTLDVQYLNISEINKFVESIEDGIQPRAISRYMILTAIFTGMRLGEISALTWQDIDFKNHMISITKSLDSVNREIKEPKTKASIRTIRVNLTLLKYLKQLNHGQKYVFASLTGEIPTSNAVNHMLRSHLKKCHIKRNNFHFHSLRHSHVALLLSSGVDLYAISKRLGHSNIMITANTYAYLIDEAKAKSDDRIESVLDDLLAQNLHKKSSNPTGSSLNQ